MSMFEQSAEAAAFLRARLGDVPDVAVVLGSGLGDFATGLTDAVTVPYQDIPHWPRATVVGHAGTVVAGSSKGRRVLALAGRAHYYEGHPLTVARLRCGCWDNWA